MATEKWKRRDAKLRKKKTGMRVSGRSVFVLQEIQKKKAEAAKRSKPSKRKKKKKK